LRDYFYNILVCILIISILAQIVTSTKQKQLMRLISGIFLAISIFTPLAQINWSSLLSVSSLPAFYAAPYIAEGKKTALETQKTVIKDTCESYILNKAKSLGADIIIELSLNEELLPVFAEIYSETDLSIQIQLQKILTEDLGIPKEHQIWISYQESNSS